MSMPDDVKRELRRLARSDEVHVADTATSAGPSKIAPGYQSDAMVVPGTNVLWIAGDPATVDPTVLPPGANLIAATSTDEARRLLTGGREPISLLISDIERADGGNAGLTALKSFRDEGLYNGPAVFFTIRPTRGQVDEANRMNASVTSSPDELRYLVQRFLPLAPPPMAAPTASYSSSAPS
jgi:hypothetical protein